MTFSSSAATQNQQVTVSIPPTPQVPAASPSSVACCCNSLYGRIISVPFINSIRQPQYSDRVTIVTVAAGVLEFTATIGGTLCWQKLSEHPGYCQATVLTDEEFGGVITGGALLATAITTIFYCILKP